MRQNEKEFKAGNYLYTEFSYDGGFGRSATIYLINKVTEKSITITKVCHKYNCDCSTKEAQQLFFTEKPKTVRINVVDEKSFYDWKFGEKYVNITNESGTKNIAWATEQFTEFSDVKDTGSYYELK